MHSLFVPTHKSQYSYSKSCSVGRSMVIVESHSFEPWRLSRWALHFEVMLSELFIDWCSKLRACGSTIESRQMRLIICYVHWGMDDVWDRHSTPQGTFIPLATILSFGGHVAATVVSSFNVYENKNLTNLITFEKI